MTVIKTRASKFLRQRALMNRTRYSMRALVTEVLPSLVGSMRLMHDTLRIQGSTLQREFENRTRDDA